MTTSAVTARHHEEPHQHQLEEPEFRVHRDSFVPPRRGRTPLTNVEPFVAHAETHRGQWVSKDYTEANANSVLRQIKARYPADVIEACSLSAGPGRRTVYLRVL